MELDSPTFVTNWIVDSSTTNKTTPYPGHIYSFQPPSFAHPSSIVVGNGSVLSVTLLGNSVLPRPFYLNDVLIALDLAPDLVLSLLFVYRLTTDNFCSMEFDHFGLSMKNLATKRVLAR
jgi:hypothetical protein